MSALGHHKEIIELRNKGYSREKIGELFGVSYQRIGQILRKYGAGGRLPKVEPHKKTDEERFKIRSQKFWTHVDITSKDACWEWTLSRDPRGYGRYRFSSLKPFAGGYAHRTAWILTNGKIPPGLCVCHSCDNPACCNPNHLWLGTMTENIKDRDKKNRGSIGRKKIEESIVQSVLRDYSNGMIQVKIARTYGICLGTVQRIVHRKGCYKNL